MAGNPGILQNFWKDSGWMFYEAVSAGSRVKWEWPCLKLPTEIYFTFVTAGMRTLARVTVKHHLGITENLEM